MRYSGGLVRLSGTSGNTTIDGTLGVTGEDMIGIVNAGTVSSSENVHFSWRIYKQKVADLTNHNMLLEAG
ncbi:hypothetical protein [Halobacillus karajensis]|uniref:hypothetical protein n=1 Tax=Halobacillus karajensis TaxID=195088 RepID=UPI001114C73F|nr:hypothetical protein [Halobacillus karajensis]